MHKWELCDRLYDNQNSQNYTISTYLWDWFQEQYLTKIVNYSVMIGNSQIPFFEGGREVIVGTISVLLTDLGKMSIVSQCRQNAYKNISVA